MSIFSEVWIITSFGPFPRPCAALLASAPWLCSLILACILSDASTAISPSLPRHPLAALLHYKPSLVLFSSPHHIYPWVPGLQRSKTIVQVISCRRRLRHSCTINNTTTPSRYFPFHTPFVALPQLQSMAVSLQKRILRPGNGKDYPRKLDEVIIEYTGWLHDANLADQGYKGEE